MTVCYFCYLTDASGERRTMSRKKNGANIVSVTYSYTGTDDQFDEFLKMMLHDYLAVDNPYTKQEPELVDNVESGVA